MATITIKNEFLTAKIKSLGAELTSVTDKDGKEYIWEGREEFWDGQAPVLFPIVGRLKNGRYTYKGKTYEMKAHGFAKETEFMVEEQSENSVTFFISSNEETLKQYPFLFEFRVRFTLEGKKLIVSYITDNKGEGEMLYNVGSHEAYNIDGIDNYSLVLDEAETLDRFEVEPSGIICEKGIPCFENSRELKLSDDFFTVDAIILFDIKSTGIALRDDRDGSQIYVDFKGNNSILIWRKPKAPFACIETWAGAPDVPWDKTDNFEEKYRMKFLPAGEREIITHNIAF